VATKVKDARKTAFYKRTRKDKPGIQDKDLQVLWAEKKKTLPPVQSK